MRFSRASVEMVFAALGLSAWALPAQSETPLYRFKGGSDGGIPYAGLIADEQGALYGATDVGGINDNGTVFRLAPPASGNAAWTKTVLYQFSGGADGAQPQSSLVRDAKDALYGTTVGGGVAAGTIFRLDPPIKGKTAWTETVLYRFGGGSDGASPSGLVADAQGALYGTTEFGGSSSCNIGYGCGTVFKLTPPARGHSAWTETVLHRFTGGSDGADPLSSLIIDADGALYGTTPYGGDAGCAANGCGTVFKLTPSDAGRTHWTERVIYRFHGGSDGAAPNAGLTMDRDGALYGPTTQGGLNACKDENGCGTIFKLTPPANGQTGWTEAVLYRLKGGRDGGFPNSTLSADRYGALYGSTNTGGVSGCLESGCGTIFRLAPPTKDEPAWKESVLHRFTGGADGAYSGPLLVADKQHALFGTAAILGSNGCGGYGCGTVFELRLCPAAWDHVEERW